MTTSVHRARTRLLKMKRNVTIQMNRLNLKWPAVFLEARWIEIVHPDEQDPLSETGEGCGVDGRSVALTSSLTADLDAIELRLKEFIEDYLTRHSSKGRAP